MKPIVVTQIELDQARAETQFRAEMEARYLKEVLMPAWYQEVFEQGKLMGRIYAYQERLQLALTPEQALLAMPRSDLERLAESLKQELLLSLEASDCSVVEVSDRSGQA